MYLKIIENEDFFSILGLRPQANGVKEHQKRKFTKKVIRGDFFLITGISFSCNLTKTEVFEHDDVIHHTEYTLYTY